MEQVVGGTATANFKITDREGRRWFAKVYRDHGACEQERRAVELARFAHTDQVPVPTVRRTIDGDLVENGRLPMSLWEYVEGAETAEGGLVGARWPSVGTVLGHLHRRLAEHPAAAPRQRPGAGVCALPRARARFDRLITELAQRAHLSSFEVWVLEAARERRALLGRLAQLVVRLPTLTEQIVHGDLAAPNLMLRGDRVAAVIDFQPPRPRFAAWEIARIALDPRTVVQGDEWLTGLPRLIAVYRDAHPAATAEDLLSTVAVGCAYTLASAYPLTKVLEGTGELDDTLQTYARARHQAGLTLLNRLDEAREAVHDGLR
ncbi:phosphotransferase enzyme family protein [Streptomyces sp. NPDC093589]|uniref:phosphotransferase enzyme family protein n=1 Tax=Streptomyces sp. NPDC093589 TaxID=3366043 RepID=UPI00381ECEF9